MTIALIILAPFVCAAVVVCYLMSRAEPMPDEIPPFEIPAVNLAELNTIRLRYFERNEQAEADAARACALLGIDPRAKTSERDWADEIALHGSHVMPAIGRIQRWRAMVQ
jgi:hypothetical protein